MRDRDDRDARTAFGGEQQRSGLERLASAPELESRSRQHAVEPEREFLALARRVERLEIEDADALERRALNLLHEPREIGIALGWTALQDRRDQRLLPAVRLHVGRSRPVRADRRPLP